MTGWGSPYGDAPGTDVLDSRSTQPDPRGAADRPSRRGNRLVAAIGAAIAVTLIGGTASAVGLLLSGGGPQPEDVFPGNAFAFAKIDLDPAAGQKIALARLLHKFP